MSFLERFVLVTLFGLESIVLFICFKIYEFLITPVDFFILFIVAAFSFYLYIIAVTGILKLK